ncbi:hypothetical protein PVT68_05975 [Microbulbifer bruguierae]|uniref:FimV N-terminal domain-containing protein n=1 Tax=Microbulbifer bruguierae TaxID=3029061 RepID=A0ABY8NHB3_9GAMM|nr:FimV/HubP family polar landmark protein [Microbulbifer bruguierae]WGL17840.1 hypothetical protein PVT68_05975 [Microbulbifer bruguierae]
MRVQKLALAVGLVSALGGNAALALGLGEVKLNSTLNQPLNAEIKLLQTRGLGENEIKVRLASTEDFERAGVDRSYLLDELRFTVDYSSGQPVVRISSRNPIREPFLNFLVETRWPSGRLLREYTLLMDLPAFSTNTASQPVRAAERERQQVRRDIPVQQPIQRPVQQEVQPPVPAPIEQQVPEFEESAGAVSETVAAEPQQPLYEEPAELTVETPVETSAASGSRVYGPVEANKTLWEIARDSRENRSMSVQQTMLAIQRLNPEAFINNNINLLKKGAVLRLPTAEEVRTLTLTEAVSQVATQNDAWRDRVGSAEVTGAALDGRAVVEESVESDVLEGRVSLAAPGDNESVLSGSGSGTGESEALQGELAVSEEELDKSRLENAELQERIGELNEQIDTMERMVEVSSEEMRAVQAAAEQTAQDEGIDGGVDGVAIEDDVASESEAALGEQLQSEAETVDSAPVIAAEPEATEVAPEDDDARNRVVVQTVQEPTLVERLMENIQLFGIGAGALVIALAGFFTWRRRKEEEEAIRQVEAEMAMEPGLAEDSELFSEDDSLAAVEELEASENFDLDELGEIQTDDPVAEAEIHLSLGQYQEAEAKLLTGLKAAPENIDARLMLLEVYAQQQSPEQFDDHYRQLLTYNDGPVADRAARLRESIAGIGPFVAPEMDFSSESLEAAQLDDLGADFDAEASFEDLDEFASVKAEVPADETDDDDFGLLEGLDLADDSFGSADGSLDLADGSLDLADGSLDLADGSFDLEGESLGGQDSAEQDEFDLELDLDDDLEMGLDSGLDLEGEPGMGDSAEDELTLDLEGEEFSLDLEQDAGLELELSAEPDTEADDFELEDLVADGGLDLENLDGLDLDSDFDIEPAQSVPAPIGSAAADQPEQAGGLEFDLDLTPMDDADGEPDDELDAFGDDLDTFGNDLEGLDLDSIDLGDLELDGAEPELGSVDVGHAGLTTTGALELEDDLDLVVAEASVSPASEPSAEESELEDDLGFDLEGDLNSELNLMEGTDEFSTKLELAQAYLDMGDKDGAREILGEVVDEAAGEHQQRAKDLLERMT